MLEQVKTKINTKKQQIRKKNRQLLPDFFRGDLKQFFLSIFKHTNVRKTELATVLHEDSEVRTSLPPLPPDEKFLVYFSVSV